MRMTALLRHHFDRASVVAQGGLVVIACFFAALACPAGTWDDNRWFVLILLPVVARYLVTFELTGTFTIARSSFADPSALVRQRVQVWPFVLVLLVLPVVVTRAERCASPNRPSQRVSLGRST